MQFLAVSKLHREVFVNKMPEQCLLGQKHIIHVVKSLFSVNLETWVTKTELPRLSCFRRENFRLEVFN